MKISIPYLISSVLIAGASLTASAVPAYPGPRTYTQPDGTVITLSLRGDESWHYFVDDDGHIIGRDETGCFRLFGNDGRLTDIQAGKLTSLSDGQQATLASLSPQTIHDNIASQPMRFSTRRSAPLQRAAPGLTSKWDNKDGHDIRNVPTDGERHVLIILVNFKDIAWSFSDNPGQDMHDMLNKPGFDKFHCTGSARDYFDLSSDGVYQPVFDVYGPVDLPQRCEYYGGNSSTSGTGGDDKNPWQMVIDACALLDDKVDFSIYDTNGDGLVDNVYILYAGYGENEGAPSWTVWPHSYNLKYVMATLPEHDGVKIDRYACSNELTYRTIGDDELTMAGIGTFCHEFSHVLGLPDLYETSYSTGAFTPGEFSLMDHGSYNNVGRTPPIYSAYERFALEWQKPVDITGEENINLLPLVDGGLTYRITIDPSDPSEYFLLENRQQNSWDTFIPNHGLLVWHIDYDRDAWMYNRVNNNASHQCVDLVEANNQQSGSYTGIPFPGGDNIGSFTASTQPTFKNWNGKTTALSLTNIYESPSGMISVRIGQGEKTSLDIPTPEVYLTASNDNSLTFGWNKVKGATDYAITVSKMATDIFGSYSRSVVPGYELKRLGDTDRYTISGLENDQTYDIEVYALNESNASLPSFGNYATIASTFGSTTPRLYVTPDKESALIEWPAIEGAEHYTLTVGSLKPGETTTGAVVGFDDKKAPSGMLFPGATFETREGYYGESAPSLRFTRPTGQIVSPQFTSDVASVSFWARTNRQNGELSIKFYAVDTDPLNPFSEGNLRYIGEVTDIEANSTGSKVTVNNFPSDVKKVMMLYTIRTAGLNFYIDDIEYRLGGNDQIIPLDGYDNLRVAGTDYSVTGLTPLTDYAAYMQAHNASGSTQQSKVIRFTTTETSGIDLITADSGASAFTFRNGLVVPVDGEALDIYTLDGRIVAHSARGAVMLPARGLYVVVSAKGASKLIW